MKTQILKIIDAEGLTPARFADEIGVQRSSISHIISGRNKPSYDFILKILNRFSGINAEWLITGKGSMIKAAVKPEIAGNTLFEETNDVASDKRVGTHNEPRQHSSVDTTNLSQSESKQNIKTNAMDKVSFVSKREITNVNETDFILIFYKDGTFKHFNTRE